MIKPQPEGVEEEEQEEQGDLDAMGSHRDLPLQVGFKIFFRLCSMVGVRSVWTLVVPLKFPHDRRRF